jgi:5-methyltetrahydropteroyltriglutamate--homocysteine methyltransferase
LSDITTTVIGAYPKIGDEPGMQALRRALHQHDRGEIDDAALDAEFDRATARVVREIDEAGVDLPNHGAVRWDDLFSPFVRVWTNVAGEALERWFDNNTYFRVPQVTGEIAARGPATLHEYDVARRATTKRVKGALPGPVTFARLADDRHYRDRRALALAVARALRVEVDALSAAGCELIDVEEPALALHPEDLAIAREAYTILARGAGAKVAVHLTMFPADRVAAKLGELPVAQIGIDLVSRPTRALESIAIDARQSLVLGAVDARNTRLEAAGDIARQVDAAARRVDRSRLQLAPTTSLEYLPLDVARAKLRVLVDGARAAVAAGGAR